MLASDVHMYVPLFSIGTPLALATLSEKNQHGDGSAPWLTKLRLRNSRRERKQTEVCCDIGAHRRTVDGSMIRTHVVPAISRALLTPAARASEIHAGCSRFVLPRALFNIHRHRRLFPMFRLPAAHQLCCYLYCTTFPHAAPPFPLYVVPPPRSPPSRRSSASSTRRRAWSMSATRGAPARAA